jgi:hypothetical protein
MGIAAGFLAADHNYIRVGYRWNPDPNTAHPVPFADEIGQEDYVEYWADELQIFHNPRARAPLDPAVFNGVTQHFFRDGQQILVIPEKTVLTSYTLILELL